VTVTQKFDIPPRTFFANVFGAMIRDIIPAVYRFNPIATVPFKPAAPGMLPEGR
jgi:hypothetical protein